MKSLLARFIKQFRSQRGFSLLELLVVISIIGILMAMGAVAYSTTQRKTRDSRRRADLQQVQKAFEQYAAETDVNGIPNGYDACATMASTDVLPGGLPTDPQTGDDYTCFGSAADNAYCICATLEEESTGNATTINTTTSCNYGAAGDFYCVSNLQ